MSKSGAVQKTAKVVHFVKNAIELVTNLVAQNYGGAIWSAVKILPALIAIIFFLIIAPLIIFLYLPALILDSLNPFSSSNTDVSGAYIQEQIYILYEDYNRQFDDYILVLEDMFAGGGLDPVFSYSGYGSNPTLEITRKTAKSGSAIDILWLATLLSVHTANEPDNITPESIAEFISALVTYSVAEEITKVIEAMFEPTTLEITRTLNLEFKDPVYIMSILGFDEQQQQWAEFMHWAVSGQLDYLP